MKLFQVDPRNFISVDTVSGITISDNFAVVITTTGAKHRITLEQVRLLLSCFEVIKPIIELSSLHNGH